MCRSASSSLAQAVEGSRTVCKKITSMLIFALQRLSIDPKLLILRPISKAPTATSDAQRYSDAPCDKQSMHALTHRCYSAGARFVINRIIAPCLAPAPFHTFPDRRSSLGHGYKLVKSQTPLTTTVSQPSTASGLPGIPFPSTRSCACSTVEMSEGSVPMRALGSAGMTVQAQGLGAMGLTRWFYSYHSKDDTSTEEDSFATVARAVEMAAPNPLFVDTADFYGPFTNEEFVGEVPWFVFVCCFCVCCLLLWLLSAFVIVATVARAVEMAAPNPLFVDTADFYGPFTN
eukprot:gene25295-10949_t